MKNERELFEAWHNYHWNSLRVFITVESLVGLVTINTLNMPKGSNLWYMKK